MQGNMYENMYEEAIKEMDKYIQSLKQLREADPELAKKISRESLQKPGILDKDGKLASPYNGQKMHEDDFSRGTAEMYYGEDER